MNKLLHGLVSGLLLVSTALGDADGPVEDRALEVLKSMGDALAGAKGFTVRAVKKVDEPVGRGLMAQPKLLLLDEPSLGLAPTVVQEIFRIITTISREEGLTVLLVEQNATMALRASQYGYVLETGRIVLEANSAELRENETVRRSYLGY